MPRTIEQSARYREQKNKRRREHPDTRWEVVNRDRARAQTQRWRANNPEKWKAQQKRSAAKRKASGLTEAQKQAARDRAMAWHRSHPIEARKLGLKWRRENPERANKNGRRSVLTRRARQKELFVERIDPDVVYERSVGMCGVCAKPVDKGECWHVDHIVPMAKGGRHAYSNVQLAHAFCNKSKGVKVLAA